MINTEEIKETWLRMCGSCDAGIPAPCACPDGDYRPVMLELIREVERLGALPSTPAGDTQGARPVGYWDVAAGKWVMT